MSFDRLNPYNIFPNCFIHPVPPEQCSNCGAFSCKQCAQQGSNICIFCGSFFVVTNAPTLTINSTQWYSTGTGAFIQVNEEEKIIKEDEPYY